VTFSDQGHLTEEVVTVDIDTDDDNPLSYYKRFLEDTWWYQGHCIETADQVAKKIRAAIQEANRRYD
jgi:broad specificity phosphatase PhoE